MEATVLGAGVSGLTTALVFERAGHHVQVVAREPGLTATSGAAGAMWLPVRLPEGSPQFRWALRSYGVFRDLALAAPEAGVDMVTACEVVESDERPWWTPYVDDVERRTLDGVYPHAPSAWTFRTPRIEPAIYLPWLQSQLNGPVTFREVVSLDDLESGLVLNCAGMGARRLTGDTSLTPVFGQTVIVEPGSLPLDMMLGDERDADAIFYSIPRRREVVLGGCRTEIDEGEDPPPDDELTRAILDRTRAAGYLPGDVLRVRCGVRPVRDVPRVEREGRIVHNYGHGGSGFALSWGCAEEALQLAERE